MKRETLLFFSCTMFLFFSCETTSLYSSGAGSNSSDSVGSDSFSNTESKVFIMDGEEYKESFFSDTECWKVYSGSYDEATLFRVGYFKRYDSVGFIFYGTDSTGVKTSFFRRGLDLRWDWGWKDEGDGTGSYLYSFVIKPDGTGLYYDFSTSKDGTANARDIYKTKKLKRFQ